MEAVSKKRFRVGNFLWQAYVAINRATHRSLLSICHPSARPLQFWENSSLLCPPSILDSFWPGTDDRYPLQKSFACWLVLVLLWSPSLHELQLRGSTATELAQCQDTSRHQASCRTIPAKHRGSAAL